MEHFLKLKKKKKNEFDSCFQQEQEEWSKCVSAEELFEGNLPHVSLSTLS